MEQITEKMGIYTIFDRVAGCNQLMVMPNEAMAIRWFKDQVSKNSPDNYIRNHAEDFVFVKVGEIINNTGELFPDYVELVEAYDVVKGDKIETKESAN